MMASKYLMVCFRLCLTWLYSEIMAVSFSESLSYFQALLKYVSPHSHPLLHSLRRSGDTSKEVRGERPYRVDLTLMYAQPVKATPEDQPASQSISRKPSSDRHKDTLLSCTSPTLSIVISPASVSANVRPFANHGTCTPPKTHLEPRMPCVNIHRVPGYMAF